MGEQNTDVFTRRAASGLSRRASLLAIGALGVTAMAPPITVEAKNNNRRSNKRQKKAKQRCQEELEQCSAEAAQCAAQVGQCQSLFASICAGDPDCERQATCCSYFGTCDASGFISCLVAQN